MPRQDRLELLVQLLLLAHEQVLLHDFLRLGDETLLQRLDLLDHLVRRGVGTFQFPPPVHVQRVLQLLSQRLGLRALV